ncbi:OadG family transporter subunit [Propioniciclava soli]|uniref:OadG family transporter subunit n=1 Tax=Propioniciclava soli TaxID=2775081 RepID=UPI001E312E40|nr:OadG family transporter subunit [Propioniciclava soli]
MENLGWGVMMMVVGMGVVFALLAVLMGVLMLIGRLDRPLREPGEDAAPAPAPVPSAQAAPAPAAPTVRIVADGLSEDDVAAIAVAVMTHAENRRRLAGPETRRHAPGSQLFASRWLAVGRAQSHSSFTRR